MQGSKYSDEIRAKALAMCAMPKNNAAKVAKELGIPRATVYDWQATALENDPDFAAVKRQKLRALMDKSYKVLARSMDGLDNQSKALTIEKRKINKILKQIDKMAELDEETAAQLRAIVLDYTGVSMTDMVKIANACMEMHGKLDKQLHDEGDSGGVQITFADAAKELGE